MSELYRKIDLSSFSSWRKGFLLLIISFLTIPSVSAETIHTDKWIYPLLGFQITSDMVTMLMGIVILCIIFFIFWIFSYSKKVVGDLELFSHQQINVFGYFLKSIAVASGIVYLAVYLLQNDPNGVSKTLFFGILPYLATVLFLVGTIMRYRESGFKVSSLSSQFLEGRTLFWGTQPFHWGILVLFFGHLIAFLFPDTIIAWNQLTIRLLILEASAFAFGLLTLIGLTMLIIRRFSKKKIQMVTTRMDVVVYTLLLIQILSGLGVAYFVRWGSSWFSSVLSPYLFSIFTFNPDIAAISAMPWLIQLHVISAFIIVGIFPFTRFVHLLVAPIDYIWRSYQVVIWNWNRKLIRTSKKINQGKAARNH